MLNQEMWAELSHERRAELVERSWKGQGLGQKRRAGLVLALAEQNRWALEPEPEP